MKENFYRDKKTSRESPCAAELFKNDIRKRHFTGFMSKDAQKSERYKT